jgi:hypothetical protein
VRPVADKPDVLALLRAQQELSASVMAHHSPARPPLASPTRSLIEDVTLYVAISTGEELEEYLATPDGHFFAIARGEKHPLFFQYIQRPLALRLLVAARTKAVKP